MDIDFDARDAAFHWLSITRDAEFRDTLDSTAVLGAMLLLRWIEHEDMEREAVAEFDDVAFEPVIPTSLRWENWLRGSMGSAQQFLNQRLIPWLERGPAGRAGYRLEQLAKALALTDGLQHGILNDLVYFVDRIPLEGPRGRRATSAFFEAVVTASVERQSRGFTAEFSTPPAINELMVELADPKPGERIYDPCFGLGGLLSSCARRLSDIETYSPAEWEIVQRQCIFGIELRLTPYVIGLARTVLAGISDPGLQLGNALERAVIGSQASERFDVVVANPPWGGKSNLPIDHFRFRTSYSESLFLQHIADSLRPGGRAVVVLPEGLLFRSGPDRDLREWLLKTFRLEGVISLPPNAFQPFTAVKTNLLLIRKAAPSSSVRFTRVAHLLGTYGKPRADAESPVDVATRFRAGKPGPDLWEVPTDTLLAKNAELVATQPSGDDLLQQLEQLRELSGELEIVSLADVADVRGGWNYKKEDLVESENGIGARLIRVGDMTDGGELRFPSLRLSPDAGRQPEERFAVQPGDVLISTSGTLAKVAEVPATTEPMVASKSLVTIRPSLPKEGRSRVPSEYLAALLRSSTYQQWLLSRSTGSVIRHLNLSMLREMPIPVPDLGIQFRVARHARESGGDALTILTHILTGNELDPVAAWLESDPEVRAILRLSVGESTEIVARVERLAMSISQVRNKVAHNVIDTTQVSAPMRAWVLAFAEMLRPLNGLTRIPVGPSRFAVLETARLASLATLNALSNEQLLLTGTARDLTKKVASLIDAVSQEMLSEHAFNAILANDQVDGTGNREAVVRLRYQGKLPLRDVRLRTVPDIGTTSSDFVTGGDTLSLSATIPASAPPGEFRFVVRWQGERLDGQQVRGESSLSVLVTAHAVTEKAADLGPNPYIPSGQPVTLKRSNVFFGRDDIIKQIRRCFPEGNPGNVVLLVGNRRMGKTSILYRLRGDATPGWIVAYCSLQEGGGSTKGIGLVDHRFFRLLAQKICDDLAQAGIPTWLPGVPEPTGTDPLPLQFSVAAERYFQVDDPFTAFEFYASSAVEACKQRGKRLLLVIDEFDKLQEGIEAGVTSPTVPGNLRAFLHRNADDMSALISGATAIGESQRDYWSALHGFGYRIDVGPLSPEAARLLVTEPVRDRLRYVDEARDLVLDLCGRHPHLMQVVCNRIFEDAHEQGFRTATTSIVDAAVSRIVDGRNVHFDTIWAELGSDRRRILLALCDRLAVQSVENSEPVTLARLEAEFELRGIAMHGVDGLAEDLAALQAFELITFTDDTYRLTMPIMARWIRRKDIADLQRRAQREAEEEQG